MDSLICLDHMKIMLAVISKEHRSKDHRRTNRRSISGDMKGSRLLRSGPFRAVRILPVAPGSVVRLEESWIEMGL